MKTLSRQHTSCSGLWKCLTRLLAASLRSSCTSAECIPDGKHRNMRIFTVFMRKKVRPEHDLLLQHKQTSRSGIVIKNVLLCQWRTASAAEWSQHCSHALRRRRQLRRSSRPPSSVLLRSRRHQLTNQDSLQAAVTHAFPQPSATRKSAGRKQFYFTYFILFLSR